MQKEAAPCPQRSGDTRLLICVEEEGWVETGGRGTTWRPVSCVVFGSNRASFFDAAIRLGGVPGSSRGENLSDERSPRDLEEAPLKAECSEPLRCYYWSAVIFCYYWSAVMFSESRPPKFVFDLFFVVTKSQ